MLFFLPFATDFSFPFSAFIRTHTIGHQNIAGNSSHRTTKSVTFVLHISFFYYGIAKALGGAGAVAQVISLTIDVWARRMQDKGGALDFLP